MDTEYIDVPDITDAVFLLAATEQQIKGLRAAYQSIKDDYSGRYTDNYLTVLSEIEQHGLALAKVKKLLIDHIFAGVFPFKVKAHL